MEKNLNPAEEQEINFNILLSVEPFYNVEPTTGKILKYDKNSAKKSLYNIIESFCYKYGRSKEQTIENIKKIIQTKRNMSNANNFETEYNIIEELIKEYEQENNER